MGLAATERPAGRDRLLRTRRVMLRAFAMAAAVAVALAAAVTMTRRRRSALAVRPARAMTLAVTRLRRQHLCRPPLAGWEGMIGDDRHALLDQLLDVPQKSTLLAVTERDRDAVGTGAGSAADAVDIAFRHVRQVEIDDMRDAVDRLGCDVAPREILGDLVGAVLGAAEDEDAVDRLVLEQFGKERAFVGA